VSERALIDWLRRRIGSSERVAVGPGDDAAVLGPVEGRPVVTVDAFLEGVHFTADAAPEAVGHKAIAAGVSDIAAMGCRPVASFVTVTLSRSCDEPCVKQLGEALIAAGETYGAPLAGGDVTSWASPLAVSVTVIGETGGLEPVLRSGARPGDRLFVTGELGGSRLGRHLHAEPRVDAGVFLNRHGVTAMIDLSDGLSTDLGHLARESAVGAVVREAAIPVSDDARRLAERDGVPALRHALDDGEDFELLFTLPPDEAGRLREAWPFELPLTEIGEIREGEVLLELADGSQVSLAPHGYEHRWNE